MEKFEINIRKKINGKSRVIERIDKVLNDLDHAKAFASRMVEKYEGDDYTIRIDGKLIK